MRGRGGRRVCFGGTGGEWRAFWTGGCVQSCSRQWTDCARDTALACLCLLHLRDGPEIHRRLVRDPPRFFTHNRVRCRNLILSVSSVFIAASDQRIIKTSQAPIADVNDDVIRPIAWVTPPPLLLFFLPFFVHYSNTYLLCVYLNGRRAQLTVSPVSDLNLGFVANCSNC